LNVVIIEDDNLVREAVEKGLRQYDIAADAYPSANGLFASDILVQSDVLVLDLGLPEISGFDVIKRLRKNGNMIPILVLTALDDTDSVIKALDLGADDYVIKPFDLKELSARLRALYRRRNNQVGQQLSSAEGRVFMNVQNHEVIFDEQRVDLSKMEFKILECLLMSGRKIASKSYLERNLSVDGEGVSSNTLEVHIHHLRKKLAPNVIKTVRGVGYKLNA